MADNTALLNIASCMAIDEQGDLMTDSDTALINVEKPYTAINLEKTALSGIIENDREESYLITITNNGDQPLSNLVLTDTIPELLNYVASNPEGGITSGGTKGVIIWDSSSIPAFAILLPGNEVMIRLTVTDASYRASDIDNTAYVTSFDLQASRHTDTDVATIKIIKPTSSILKCWVAGFNRDSSY